MKIKCNKCGYIGDEKEFLKGRDFFQNEYIKGSPKCSNSQNPGDASMRMFGGERPFTYIREKERTGSPLGKVLHDSNEAS